MGFNGIVLSVFGLVVAGVVYLLLTEPQLRRAQFRGRAFSKKSSALVASAVFALLVWIATLMK